MLRIGKSHDYIIAPLLIIYQLFPVLSYISGLGLYALIGTKLAGHWESLDVLYKIHPFPCFETGVYSLNGFKLEVTSTRI